MTTLDPNRNYRELKMKLTNKLQKKKKVEKNPFDNVLLLDPYQDDVFDNFGQLLLESIKRIFDSSDSAKFKVVVACAFTINRDQLRNRRVENNSVKLGYYFEISSGTNVRGTFAIIKSKKEFDKNNPVRFFAKPVRVNNFYQNYKKIYSPTSKFTIKFGSFGEFTSIFCYAIDVDKFTSYLESSQDDGQIIQNAFIKSFNYASNQRSIMNAVNKNMDKSNKLSNKDIFNVLWNGNRFEDNEDIEEYFI